MDSDNLDKNPPSSSSNRRKRNKWTFWPSFLLLLFSVNVLSLLVFFILNNDMYEKVSVIVPGLWSAFTILITYLGIKKAKVTTWLSFFRLLPTGMIIIFYTMVNILLVTYLFLTGVKEHKIFVTAFLDNNKQSMVEIVLDSILIEKTLPSGILSDPIITKSGMHALSAVFGNLKTTKNINVDWLGPFEQDVEIYLVSSKIDESQNGSIFIRARIDNKIVNGVNLVVEKTGEVFNTPDTLILSVGKHTIKADITRNGKVFHGERFVNINAGLNENVVIDLIEVDCLPKSLIINAEYNGEEIYKLVTIIINRDTFQRKLPTTITNLRDREINVKVLYRYSGFLYEGSTQEPLRMNCGEKRPIMISLR